MPLSDKGRKIMSAMQSQYGSERGKRVFYASANKGRIKGVEKREKRGRRGGKRK
jgi:hypothetical protein